jgi:DNA primase
MSTPSATHSADEDVRALRAVTAAAAAVFTEPLRTRAAISYLRQRGVDASGLQTQWLLGYAPPGWTRLVDKLRGRFPDEALLAAGVARRSTRGTLIDTFRDRLMFGIRHPDGTVAGFIGRDLSGHPSAPKYLNTHQHALFDKSSLLYGLREGTNEAARQPVIVEGPLDVLAIATRAQIDAACGTSFTDAHAARIAEPAFVHESPVVVAMDSDGPGQVAALAAGDRLRSRGLDVRLATLPIGSDPAEYLGRADACLDTFRADHGLPLIRAHVENAIATQGDRMQWVEGRLGALRSVVDYLATYAPTYAGQQIGWLAETLELAPATVTSELADAYTRAGIEPNRFRLPNTSRALALDGRSTSIEGKRGVRLPQASYLSI